MTNTHDYAEKIALLLRKAEGAANEEEAAAYFAMASKLQLKKQISDSEIRAAGQDVPIDELDTMRVSGLDKGAAYIKAKRDMVSGLARIFHCRVTMASDRSFMDLHGHTTDMAFVQAMYDSLCVQMLTMMTQAGPGDRSFKTSFAHGYAYRVVARVGAARASQENEAADTPGTAIMLRDRLVDVEKYFADRFSGMKLRAGYRNRSMRSAAGMAAGAAAADRADLGQRRVAPTRRAIGG